MKIVPAIIVVMAFGLIACGEDMVKKTTTTTSTYQPPPVVEQKTTTQIMPAE